MYLCMPLEMDILEISFLTSYVLEKQTGATICEILQKLFLWMSTSTKICQNVPFSAVCNKREPR